VSLEETRKEIDVIDAAIIALLEQRFKLVSQLKAEKKTLTDTLREAQILAKSPSKYVQNVYRAIFLNSKELLLDEGFFPSGEELIK
jgi:chorismate mutase